MSVIIRPDCTAQHAAIPGHLGIAWVRSNSPEAIEIIRNIRQNIPTQPAPGYDRFQDAWVVGINSVGVLEVLFDEAGIPYHYELPWSWGSPRIPEQSTGAALSREGGAAWFS
jgi:hypothetical protein